MTQYIDINGIKQMFGLKTFNEYSALTRRSDFPKHRKMIKRGRARVRLFDKREVEHFKETAKMRRRGPKPKPDTFNDMAVSFLARPHGS